MRFSKRTDWSLSSNPLSEKAASKRNRAGFIDLTESNPTRCGFGYLKSDLLESLSRQANLSYQPDPHGLLSAREAVSSYYARKNVFVPLGQIFLTAGTSEAYGFIFRLLCDPGDRIAVPRPSYPLLDYLAAFNDVAIEPYELRYQNGWQMNFSSVSGALEKRPKIMALINPNNPTGHFVGNGERAEITQRCRESGAAILSDEVFLDYHFENGAEPSTFAEETATLAFTLGGVSKLFGLPQMKLSWIVVSGPEEARGAAIERLEMIADMHLSVNTLSQNALPEWFKFQAANTEEIRGRCRQNYAFLVERLNGSSQWRYLRAEGGWYAVLSVESDRADETLALELLEKQDVLVHPGYFFDFPEGEFLVVSLLVRPDIFKEGVERILAI